MGDLSQILRDWPGKSDRDGQEHPAVYHMLDVAAVAEVLIEPIEMPQPLREAIILLTALHDLGKIGDPFRAMLRKRIAQAARHWEYSEVLLQHHDSFLGGRLGGEYARRKQLYAATAGHHGQPPKRDAWTSRALRDLGPAALRDSGAVIEAFCALWPRASLDGVSLKKAKTLSWWLPGLVAAADWIGSNETWFDCTPPGLDAATYLVQKRDTALHAVQEAGLIAPDPSARPFFAFEALRPMQEAMTQLALPDGPLLAVIEDETGAGKTEAALMLAQRMLCAGKGRGVYFALPTMATANAMFSRVRDSVAGLFARPPSLALAHGRAATSNAFRELVAQSAQATDEPVCTEWLADNRRRALLANVGVGTIDQALLSVLPTKHATLRHYGLSSKILIVDEVHEMGDPYMEEGLIRLLSAHRAAGGSAILLTATLPLRQRAALLASYEDTDSGARAYPAVTVAGQTYPVSARPNLRGAVQVERLTTPDEAVTLLQRHAAQGAACLWVRNAVDDAIAGCAALRAAGVPAELLHARFALRDRLQHEAAALARFGKEGAGRAGRVLVATQVVESSLNLDFDVMVSDLAPMAALVQRAGRLWRHMDKRPAKGRPVSAPVLSVLAPDPDLVEDDRWLARVLDGGAWVYPLDLQWRTARVLFDAGQIDAPSHLRDLIEAAHGAGDLPAVLEKAEIVREGLGRAHMNRARLNYVDFAKGYRLAGLGIEDALYPTRLGLPTRTLFLAVQDGDRLRPYGGSGFDGAQLSQVSASEHRLSRLSLPDQDSTLIRALTADWPKWRKESETVCSLGPDGHICEGLRYNPQQGLLFE